MQRGELGDDLLAGESLPDMDTSIVLFIMAHRCSNTEKPRKWPVSGGVLSNPKHETINLFQFVEGVIIANCNWDQS